MVKAADQPTFYLLNLGCAKNLVEGEHLAGMLLSHGFQAVADLSAAQWLLVNTCGFLTSAIEENIDYILELASAKKAEQKLVVVGCLVGRFGKKLQRSLPEVDLFISPGQVQMLPQLLAAMPASGLALAPVSGILGFTTPRVISTGPGWAYLRLSDGCASNCFFCAIPHIRGKLRSRPLDDIIKEAAFMGTQGIKEINLVAQDVSAYGQDLGIQDGLLHLLQKLEQIPQINWIRLLYLHPAVLRPIFLQAMCAFKKVLPYFDIPLQHIATKVLTHMGRLHTSEELMANLGLLRALLPQSIIRSTLMVGHPGEDEEEFNQLIDFISDFKFDHLGCFMFEPQPGTKSAKLPRVAKKIARQRQKKIMSIQKKIRRVHSRSLAGTEQSMLFLGNHPQSEQLGWGRLWSQAPEVDGTVIVVDGQAAPGTIVRVRILKAHDYDYEAAIF